MEAPRRSVVAWLLLTLLGWEFGRSGMKGCVGEMERGGGRVCGDGVGVSVGVGVGAWIGEGCPGGIDDCDCVCCGCGV